MIERIRIRVDITTDDNGWPPTNAEYLWAESLPDGTFRIDNIPIYARGISCEDVIGAEISDAEYRYITVLRRGGHSTYRVALLKTEELTDEPTARLWEKLASESCSFEGLASQRFYAIDVPKEANIDIVYDVLEEGLRDQLWDFEEGDYQHGRSE